MVSLEAITVAQRRHVRDTQDLVSACLDCDGDTLLLQVKQHGAGACHTGRRCFFYHPEDGSWRLREDD